MRNTALIAAGLAACAWLPGASHAQGWPTRPIVIQSGHPSGSSGETALRLIQPKMSEILGQPFVMEVRGGASGSLAAHAVAKAQPDGYSILSIGAGGMVSRQFMVKNVPYDAVKDFAPIGQFAKAITFMTVHVSVPANNVKELIELAKKYPGKYTYGSTGIGSPFHIMAESLKLATGINIRHVPYSQGQSALQQNDLLSGTINIYFPSYSVLRQFIDSGKVRVLAVTENKRYKGRPDVPTISETVPSFRKAPSWNAMFGPRALPQPLVKRFSDAMIKALDDPEVEKRMEAAGLMPVGNTPEEFAKELREEIEDFGKIAKALGLTPK
jgi:tripartite-type tricarboxylate transporter receptor subunit TctC